MRDGIRASDCSRPSTKACMVVPNASTAHGRPTDHWVGPHREAKTSPRGHAGVRALYRSARYPSGRGGSRPGCRRGPVGFLPCGRSSRFLAGSMTREFFKFREFNSKRLDFQLFCCRTPGPIFPDPSRTFNFWFLMIRVFTKNIFSMANFVYQSNVIWRRTGPNFRFPGLLEDPTKSLF